MPCLPEVAYVADVQLSFVVIIKNWFKV